MTDQDFSKMTEDELMEVHFDLSMEIADRMRAVLDMKREVSKAAKVLDKIDLQLEVRQSQALKAENKLN